MSLNLNLIDDERVFYVAIVLSCVVAVYVTAYHDFDQNKATAEMYFINYPESVSQNQSVEFSFIILNHDDRNRNYTISIFLDDVKQKSMDVTIGSNNQFISIESLGNNLGKGEHRVGVQLYDKELPFTSHGSKSIPYYIFFIVDVV